MKELIISHPSKGLWLRISSRYLAMDGGSYIPLSYHHICSLDINFGNDCIIPCALTLSPLVLFPSPFLFLMHCDKGVKGWQQKIRTRESERKLSGRR